MILFLSLIHFILESKGFLIVGGYDRKKKELDLIELVERKWSMNEAVKFLEGPKVRKRVRYLNFKSQVGIIWDGNKVYEEIYQMVINLQINWAEGAPVILIALEDGQNDSIKKYSMYSEGLCISQASPEKQWKGYIQVYGKRFIMK